MGGGQGQRRITLRGYTAPSLGRAPHQFGRVQATLARGKRRVVWGSTDALAREENHRFMRTPVCAVSSQSRAEVASQQHLDACSTPARHSCSNA